MQTLTQSSFNSTVKLASEGQPSGFPLYLGQPTTCEVNKPYLSQLISSEGYQNWTFSKLDDGLNDTYTVSVVRRGCPSNYLSVSTNCDDHYVDLKEAAECASQSHTWKLTAVTNRTDYYQISSTARTTANCTRVLLNSGFNNTIIDLAPTDDGSGRQEWELSGYPVTVVDTGYVEVIGGKPASKKNKK